MKISKILLVASAAFIFVSLNLNAESKSVGETMGSGIGRGFLNILTSPAELPHHFVYDIEDKGAVGIITGFGKGMIYTFGRMFTGMCDMLTLGFVEENDGLYSSLQMKPYVWEEDWIPRKEIPESAKKSKTPKKKVVEKIVIEEIVEEDLEKEEK